jgi:hypothetical protein
MSEATRTSTKRSARHVASEATTQPTQHEGANGASEPSVEVTQPVTNVVDPSTLPPVTFTLNKLGDMAITVERRHGAGYVLADENEALLYDMAKVSQFRQNINAYCEARAKRLAKATTPEDIAANQPLTNAEVLDRWAHYETIQKTGTPRQSSMEKLRFDAAWRAWVGLVTDHNASVAKGGPAVLAKGVDRATGAPVLVKLMTPPVKKRGSDDAVHEAALTQFAEVKAAFVRRMQSLPEYAAAIQAAMDAIVAERGAKAEPTTAVAIDIGSDML